MSNVVTARIDDDVLAMVDRLAASRERSRSWIVARLIESAARAQLESDAFIQVGLDDIEVGRTIAHDQLVDTIMKRRARPAAA